MAGPWFTVHRNGGDWRVLDRILVSNGKSHKRATVEGRVTFPKQEPDKGE